MNIYPKVLVIANNCFSLNNSNGRTLGGFFDGWPKDRLAQFCLGLDQPNYDLCDNYYCVTDSDAVRAVTLGSAHKLMDEKESCIPQNISRRKHKKTALSMLIRNIVWNSNRWRKKSFDRWIDEFAPEIVLFQNGDSAFMSKIALDIAKRRNIPLLVFNTEAYYFFTNTWFVLHWTDSLVFPLFNLLYKRQYRKMMKYVSHTIYCNSLLEEDYNREFKTKNSSVLYTSSSLPFKAKELESESPTFSYLGNLELNRPFALIEIANALHAINSNYVLDIYGKLSCDQENVFDKIGYIKYHGLIPYEDVKNVMQQSDFLFHAEYNKGQWIDTLKYAFSTKIADSLACGANFLLYAPSNLACSKYIIDSKGAWYVEKKSDLISTLKEMLTNAEARRSYLQRAKKLAQENHTPQINSEKFQMILLNAVLRNGRN